MDLKPIRRLTSLLLLGLLWALVPITALFGALGGLPTTDWVMGAGLVAAVAAVACQRHHRPGGGAHPHDHCRGRRGCGFPVGLGGAVATT